MVVDTVLGDYRDVFYHKLHSTVHDNQALVS
jgi:hypothetical protein